MNFWQFLDRLFGRISANGVAGMGIFILTGVVLYMLKASPELAENDLFKTLAQAIIVQGLIGLAMAAWFTKNENMQRVQIDQPADKPVPTTDETKGE